MIKTVVRSGLVILAVFTTVACYRNNTDVDRRLNELDEKIKKTNEDLKKQNENTVKEVKTAGEEKKATQLGGQPGTVRINESLGSKDTDGKVQTVSKIKVLQIGGKGADGVTMDPVYKVALGIETANEKTKALVGGLPEKKTYYAEPGCLNLDPKNVEGLTQVQPQISKDSTEIMASKVILCGKFEIQKRLHVIFADEVVLRDLDMSRKGVEGAILIYSNTMTLMGQNKISTIGGDVEESTTSLSPNITLMALKNLAGEGTLELNSTGASYSKSEKK
jgi:hypothetical protein